LGNPGFNGKNLQEYVLFYFHINLFCVVLRAVYLKINISVRKWERIKLAAVKWVQNRYICSRDYSVDTYKRVSIILEQLNNCQPFREDATSCT
jgi:hypothetical protein